MHEQDHHRSRSEKGPEVFGFPAQESVGISSEDGKGIPDKTERLANLWVANSQNERSKGVPAGLSSATTTSCRLLRCSTSSKSSFA
jgi:hypothetical protein